MPAASASSAQANISNKQPAQIYMSSPNVFKSDGKITFMLTRMGDASKYLAVRYLTIDGGAKAGLNYEAAGQIVLNAEKLTQQSL